MSTSRHIPMPGSRSMTRAGRHAGKMSITQAPVPLHQCTPVRLRESRLGACAQDLVQRAPQALQHRLLPPASRSNAAAIEVEHIDRVPRLGRRAQEDVVGIQIHVLYALAMKRGNRAAYLGP